MRSWREDRGLAELELHIVDGGFDERTPVVEHLGRVLQAVEAGALGLHEVVEAAVTLLVMVGEALAELVGQALLHLVEDELDDGIHGAGSLLEPSKVLMRGKGLQDR